MAGTYPCSSAVLPPAVAGSGTPLSIDRPAAPPGRAATAWARQTGRANCARTRDAPVPAGTEYLSPVLQHWGMPRNRPPSPGAGLPAKGRHMSLPKHPLLIGLRPRLPQQRHELLLERPFPVMFCLSRDLIGDNLPAAPPGRAATAWARQTGRANCSRTHDNPVPAGTEYLSPVLQHWGTSGKRKSARIVFLLNKSVQISVNSQLPSSTDNWRLATTPASPARARFPSLRQPSAPNTFAPTPPSSCRRRCRVQ